MKNSQKIHPIGYVSRQTGLSPHVIRAWEKRYGAVVPARTETQRRLYSDLDIRRLQLLHKAVQAGHRIAQLAGLDPASLEKLAQSGKDKTANIRLKRSAASEFFKAGLASVHALDGRALEDALNRAAIMLTRPVLLDEVIIPLVTEIGELWSTGNLKVVNEHIATTIIQAFLWDILRSAPTAQGAPRIVVATPPNQWHELGALIIAVTAAEAGWVVMYVGPNLPAAEIAAAAVHSEVSVVALSVVYQVDQIQLKRELEMLRRCLNDDITIVVGGRGVATQQENLEKIGVRHLPDVKKFRKFLNTYHQTPEHR